MGDHSIRSGDWVQMRGSFRVNSFFGAPSNS